MSLLVSESGQPLKAPIVLNEAEGYVIQKAFGITEDGMPKKPKNLFKAGIVKAGSDKEKILTAMVSKGLIQLVGVVSKLNDKQRVAFLAALEASDGPLPLAPDRYEAIVTPYGLESFLHTIRTSDAARSAAMAKVKR